MRRRDGALVTAPDGQPAQVWTYTGRPLEEVDPLDEWETLLAREPALWLWRHGALLEPIPEREARQLEVLELHPIHRDGARECTRRNHPEAEASATTCPSCGLPIEALS